jgi:hypothetical protein
MRARVYYERKFGHVHTHDKKYQWIALLGIFAAWALSVNADQTLHGSFAGWFVAAWFLILFSFTGGESGTTYFPLSCFSSLRLHQAKDDAKTK